MININSIITLSDNRNYIVISKATINTYNYIYIVDQNNYSNSKFGKIVNNKIIIVDNNEELKKIIPILNKNIEDFYKLS